MKIVAKSSPTIPACSEESKELFARAIDRFKDLPQAEIYTEHHLHAGVYSRTIHIPKGVLIIGVEMQCATQLVQYGHGFFTDGNGTKEMHGYLVLEGLPHRQCAFLATEDTWATMFFATKAKTVEEAEREFCSEPTQLLTNRKEKQLCQE
jgi:hypothetical protein